MNQLHDLIRAALAEDIGPGDITTELLVSEGLEAELQLNAREALVAAGVDAAAQVFFAVDPTLKVELRARDGVKLSPGEPLLMAHGRARALLTAERVALNLLQRMCGVATLTRQYVDAVAGTGAVILDTRKTIPGLRALDKYAVTCGGGQNHRMGLWDMVLIKDNHIALCGGVKAAVARARGASVPIVVECDTLAQVAEALEAAPERILLDNMDNATLCEAVRLSAGRVKLEASGGVNLQTVRGIAETGVDYISVGALTHSARAVDIGADVRLTPVL